MLTNSQADAFKTEMAAQLQAMWLRGYTDGMLSARDAMADHYAGMGVELLDALIGRIPPCPIAAMPEVAEHSRALAAEHTKPVPTGSQRVPGNQEAAQRQKE